MYDNSYHWMSEAERFNKETNHVYSGKQRYGSNTLVLMSRWNTNSKNYRPLFDSAEGDITERDTSQILKILCGPSPWQQYLRSNLYAHLKDLPSQPIRILMDGELVKAYKTVFKTPIPRDVQGFVNRRYATIYLQEFPAKNSGKSKLGLALHEAVHLFSHPAGRSNLLRASAYGFLGEGLLEGLTQAITEDIQMAQGIHPMRERWQAYKEYVPVAREFLRIFTPSVVGDAYFRGNLGQLVDVIHQRWTERSFKTVRALTTQRKTKEALQLIYDLEQAYVKRAMNIVPYFPPKFY